MPRNNRLTTSEVGSSTPTWIRDFLEMQNANLTEIINAVRVPNSNEQKKIVLPKYNSESQTADVVSWCNTVDFLLADNPLEGSELIIALSASLEGEAALWLSQVCYPNIKWQEFKELFIQRFKGTETSAATILNLLNGRPIVGECIATYGNRLVTSLIAKWKSMNIEQIAVSLVLAHVANVDNRLQRLIFTTSIETRSELQKELSAFSFDNKRKHASDDHHLAKRIKLVSNIKCHYCGKLGHKIAECRAKRDDQNKKNTPKQTYVEGRFEKSKTGPVCYKCGKVGHISTNCVQNRSNGFDAGKLEKNVNICTIVEPKGTLMQRGECYKFYFDSGSECSLIKESVAVKFAGNRINDIVVLKGIGSSSVYSTYQIETAVIINNYNLEILFHVVSNEAIRYDIIIGNDILGHAFCVTLTASEFTLNELKSVNICTNAEQILNYDNVDTDLENNEKPRLVSILRDYSKWLITGIPECRVTTGEMKICLVDKNKTVQRRPYRLSPQEREIVRIEIKKLLEANIIRPSQSPYASPMLLVRKKNGNNRLVVDYRELNRNTVADKYPLPLIADQIARLAGAKYFCQLDMASGFHQVPMHPDSIQYTAFVTPEGHYEYLTMPFGLKNAPACFQRAIVAALGDLAYSFAVVYMDDILVVAKNKEEAFDRLRMVMDVLTKAGFTLNLKKCAFLKKSVNYLGYKITDGELRTNEQKISALTQLPPPQSVTQLRQFIGLASYFRQFVPQFSLVMKPLYRLTSSKTLTWNAEHELIRQKIISILTSEPVLVIFDPNLPIELHTDASTLGYGAILLHRVGDKPHVIEYFSKTTSDAESRYNSYDLETLAIVNAIKHFRHYLLGYQFTVFTDCNSVKASRTKLDLSPRVHRWWSFLQNFDFEVQYREGKRMAHVDFLSRNPLTIQQPITSKVAQKRVNLADISNDWILAEQLKDHEICDIIIKLQSEKLEESVAQSYELRKGVLYRKIQRRGKTVCLPVVPRSMRWSVINNIHESLLHLGHDKTLDKVYQFYWFDKMNKYVKKFVDNCITCKISKPHSGKIAAELHPIPKIDIPFHTIHVDITGKLSGKSDFKEYLIVTVDAFSKYVLLHHTKNLSSDSCISSLKRTISLFGVPARIIADQGRSFSSKEYKDFCVTQNISLHLVATGASRANGQVERVMSTLKSMMTAIETSQRSWQDAIDEIQIALNCTVNRVTKCSPLEILIGKKARPFGLLASDSEDVINREEVCKQAVANMRNSGTYEKKRFDSKKLPVNSFNVGDFVLIRNEERQQTKLDPKFKGPFKIIEVLDGDRYLLKSLNSKRCYKYAHEHLRKTPTGYVPDDLESDTEVEHEVSESVEKDVTIIEKKNVERDVVNESVEKEKKKVLSENIEVVQKSVETDAENIK